jgi:trk system potassium uptake protein TrkH
MNVSPVKTIIIFFIALILLGTVLLCLPFAKQEYADFSLLTCLFTATSAVCVTGLSVVNVGEYFTGFGQIVILLLLQIGGLGYMLVSTGLGLLLGKMALKDRKIMQELFDISSFNGLFKLLKKAVLIVLCIEFVGAIVLTIGFLKELGLKEAIYYGIFHSISAFCNAGFCLFRNSLENFSNNPTILYTIGTLVVLGGLGFFVLVDIIDKIRGKNIKLTFHSKIILYMTLSLTVFGFIAFYIGQIGSYINQGSLSWIINNSFFQAISSRTAGFNTVSMDSMTSFTTIFFIILMFIGGGPGSTAGGIKITTLALVFVFIRAVIKGQDSYVLAKQNIDSDLVKKALLVFILMTLLVGIFISLMLLVDPNMDAVKVIFEAVSGFCTVGLSFGITSELSVTGKVLLILAMFVGRIGAITILVYLVNIKPVVNNIKYPDGKILIG